MGIEEVIGFLDHELTDLGIEGARLSLDIENPTIERLRRRVSGSSGASLQFTYQRRKYIIACDRWQAVEHNIYAIDITLRQLRNIERWGIAPLPVLFAGLEEGNVHHGTTAGTPTLAEWMEEMGLGPTATLDDAVAVYHRRARLLAHSSEHLSHLNNLMDDARAYFKSKA